jgi:hypothetical protein
VAVQFHISSSIGKADERKGSASMSLHGKQMAMLFDLPLASIDQGDLQNTPEYSSPGNRIPKSQLRQRFRLLSTLKGKQIRSRYGVSVNRSSRILWHEVLVVVVPNCICSLIKVVTGNLLQELQLRILYSFENHAKVMIGHVQNHLDD